MAIRTTSDLVRGVLLADYDDLNRPSLVPYITSGSALTDDLFTAASAKGITITAERLKLIETWLSAYHYTISDRRRKKERFFDSTTGEYGNESYLDVAKQLDPSGLLPAILKRAKAQLVWLGRPPSEQTPVWERD